MGVSIAAYLTLTSIAGVFFTLHTVILTLWIIALFKNYLRSSRKMKYVILYSNNEDSFLEALNIKVECIKSQFLLAIVLLEFLYSIFILFASLKGFLLVFHGLFNDSNTEFHNATLLGVSDYPPPTNDTGCDLTPKNYFILFLINNSFTRILSSAITIPFILTVSFIYSLMSYYVMVTTKSLTYNISLKSVDLAREQKALLVGSFIACILLLVLLVRRELYPVFLLVESCTLVTQLVLTIRFKNKLVLAIQWKMTDTKIAFGTDHYLYKYYGKSLRKFKLFIIIYIIIVVSCCLFGVIRSLRYFIVLYLNPYELYDLYGICIHFPQSNSLSVIFNMFVFDKVALSISLVSLFFLNLLSVPSLLSMSNFRCYFNCDLLSYRPTPRLTDAKTPLLA